MEKKHHRLRTARAERGATQAVLSELSGVSTSTISNIECHRGPDVPRTERRRTNTRLSTALKLTAALSQIPTGTYTLEQFVALQDLFTEGEIYEALVNQKKRDARRKRGARHLSVVRAA